MPKRKFSRRESRSRRTSRRRYRDSWGRGYLRTSQFRYDSPPKETDRRHEPRQNPSVVESAISNSASILQQKIQQKLIHCLLPRLDSHDKSQQESLALPNHHIPSFAQKLAFQTKTARDVYVGNIPDCDISEIVDFMNRMMKEYEIDILEGKPCLGGSKSSSDRSYCFLEFRTIEEAHNALMLNGIQMKFCQLKIGRPKNSPKCSELREMLIRGGAGTVAGFNLKIVNDRMLCSVDAIAGPQNTNLLHPLMPTSLIFSKFVTPNGLFDLNLADKVKHDARNLTRDENTLFHTPSRLTKKFCVMAKNCREDLEKYGKLLFYKPLPAYDFCFCEFAEKLDEERFFKNTNLPWKLPETAIEDEDVTMSALLLAADSQLDVAKKLYRRVIPSNVIILKNVVTIDDLLNDRIFDEIVEDIRLEAANFGKIQYLLIPRPEKTEIKASTLLAVVNSDVLRPQFELKNGVGLVFIQFETISGAAKAKKSLNGRKFANRTVEANYFNETKFQNRDFANAEPNFQTEEDLLREAEEKKSTKLIEPEIVD